MDVTVVSNDYVGLVEVCRRKCGKDVNARRVAGGNAVVVLSEFIDVDRRNFEFQLLDVVDMLEACRAKPTRKARFTTSALARR